VAVAVLCLVVVACSGSGRGAIGVFDVHLAGDREVVLSIDACHANAEAKVAGTSETEVVVRVVGDRSSGGDDCADGVTLCLDEDLAGRAVRDVTSGRRFVDIQRWPSSGRCTG
jgi:hypothetical protein